MDRIFKEIRKIRWPKASELFKTSAIVLVILLCCATLFTAYDLIIAKIIQIVFK